MKEQEKQICKHFDKEVCSKLDCKKDCKYYGKANCKTCIHEDICQLRTYSYCEEEVKEKGCEHYQPKLPKDCVVLSKEEYEKLKSRADNKCRYDCDLIDMPDFEREKTLIEKTSKETAEKILKDLKGHLSCMGFSIVKAYFKEQFGVEIKE